MNNKEIQELIRLIDKLEVASFKVKQGDFELCIKSKKYIESKIKGPTHMISASSMMPAPVHQEAPVQHAPQPAAPVAAAPTPAKVAVEQASGLVEIKSPMVGTFYRSASPDKPYYVQIGDEIKPGTPLCIIEAMKLFNEIESEISGKIVKILVDDSKPVEYDQPLFLVDPS
jgi:acetyl-CoA carboxylase biotin carboxyl carrier protein